MNLCDLLLIRLYKNIIVDISEDTSVNTLIVEFAQEYLEGQVTLDHWAAQEQVAHQADLDDQATQEAPDQQEQQASHLIKTLKKKLKLTLTAEIFDGVETAVIFDEVDTNSSDFRC